MFCTWILNIKLHIRIHITHLSNVSRLLNWLLYCPLVKHLISLVPNKVLVMQTWIRFKHHYCNANTSYIKNGPSGCSFLFVRRLVQNANTKWTTNESFGEMLPNYQYYFVRCGVAVMKGRKEIIMKLILKSFVFGQLIRTLVGILTTSHAYLFVADSNRILFCISLSNTWIFFFAQPRVFCSPPLRR